jgi:hypothetical protein
MLWVFVCVEASAVRLLRIEQGGAFADLLNADYRESAIDDEMDYIQRTLGFRTNPLDSRNTRLVCSFSCLCFVVVFAISIPMEPPQVLS